MRGKRLASVSNAEVYRLEFRLANDVWKKKKRKRKQKNFKAK